MAVLHFIKVYLCRIEIYRKIFQKQFYIHLQIKITLLIKFLFDTLISRNSNFVNYVFHLYHFTFIGYFTLILLILLWIIIPDKKRYFKYHESLHTGYNCVPMSNASKCIWVKYLIHKGTDFFSFFVHFYIIFLACGLFRKIKIFSSCLILNFLTL